MIIPNMLLLALDDEAFKRDRAVQSLDSAALRLNNGVPGRENMISGWDKAVTGRGKAAPEEYCGTECCIVECCCKKQPCCQLG